MVKTDVLEYALGAVLSQPDAQGKLRLVAFHGRKFIPAETRYPTHDKELLGIVDAFIH
jgi:hypothetical protein